MSRAKLVLDGEGKYYGVVIHCAAGHQHTLPTDWLPEGLTRSRLVEGLPHWTFNGDLERPTFAPSIITRAGHFITNEVNGDGCWCRYNAEHPDDMSKLQCYLCHSYVRDGQSQFLGDSSHVYRGQTVALLEIAA